MTKQLLINKFDYQPISRTNIDGKRHYCTPDGGKLPSVTTVLSATKSAESLAGLQAWRDAVGHAKAQQITTEAANTGTVMHKMVEEYILGISKPPGSNNVQKIAYPMAQVIINQGLVNLDEVWGTEIPIYFPGLYAGTTDGAGVWKGKEAIFDHKQTNKPKKREYIEDYFVQLAGYSLAHNEVHGTDIKTGVIFMCSRACEYQEFVLEGAEFQKYTDIWLNKVEEYYRLISA
jgi:genome maintenance exonuclease 1